MIFRNKALKTTAAAIAIISVVSTGMVNYSYADSYISEGIKATTTVVKDGKYTVKNTVTYVGDGNAETGNSMARQVLDEESTIEIKDGKVKTTIKFTPAMYSMLGNFRVSVDGKSIDSDDIIIDKTNRTLTFEMPSIDSEVVVTINVIMMGRDVSFKTDFDKSSIEYDEVETPETPETPET
ncbi:hypothetical protein EAI30_03895, partial [Romboutsia ilealis]|nr:hypothetical protein [Romboutsia ilealis]